MKSIETTIIDPRTASTVPITMSLIFGIEIFVCAVTFAVLSELSNSDEPMTVDLIASPSSYVFSPEIYSSIFPILSPGNFNSFVNAFLENQDY